MSKNEIYNQMPIPPSTGIGLSGIDTLLINPSSIPGNISRIRSIYIDLPTGVTLNVNLSTLGSGDQDIVSNGNEAGSIIFRDGIVYSQPVTITITGTTGTPYSVRLVTEIEVPETQNVAVTNFPSLQDVSVTNFPAPPATQNVAVTNFPSLQDVSVTNFPAPPATQNVAVTNFPTPPELQRVLVSNFPSLQGVLVTNFPTPSTPQQVEVTNFPSGGLGGAIVQQAGIPMWLALGLAFGFVYMAYKSSKEKEKSPVLVRER